MKIAMLALGYSKKGGIGRCIAELAERYSKRHDVHVFANWVETPLPKGVRYHHVPAIKSPLFSLTLTYGIMSTLALQKHRFDIIHDQWTDCLLQDVYTAQSCHRAYFEELGKRENWKTAIDPTHRLILAIEKHAVEKSKRIIAISRIVKKEILRYYGVPPEKIVVIHSGVNLQEFNPKNRGKYRRDIRKKHGIGQDDIVLLFVGWEFERKGLKQAIGALSKINGKKIKLLVVGKGDEKKYLGIAKELGVEGQVIFAGLTPKVNQYYSVSDIFVFPTLYEPFGLVITEAMASGLPVITSRLAGAAELIADGKDGFLLKDPRNVEELAEKIRTLAENKGLREKMGLAARKTAEKYSWDMVAEKTMGVFKEVLGNKRNGRST